jgi:hypothetical protein
MNQIAGAMIVSAFACIGGAVFKGLEITWWALLLIGTGLLFCAFITIGLGVLIENQHIEEIKQQVDREMMLKRDREAPQ